MSDASVRRRRHDEDAICFAADKGPKPLAEPAVPVSRHGLSNLQAAIAWPG